jgi:site-specific recombinase XerC
MLIPFLVSRGLVLAVIDDANVRGQQRRQRRIAEVPELFRPAVASFAASLDRRHERAVRLALRTNTTSTVESQLTTLRDLARLCVTTRPALTGWESIARNDVEAFLARRPLPSPRELGELRSFFRWARRQRLVLTNPVDGLSIRQTQSFNGKLLDTATQQALYRRWTTSDDVHPHEAFFGLAALIHGISTFEIRHLTDDDIDSTARTIRVGRRRQPVPLDPATWDALQHCLTFRRRLRGANRHLIVNRLSASTDGPAAASYFNVLLKPAGVTPTTLRTTRLSHLANQVDPVMVAAMFGVTHKAAAYYHGHDVAVGNPHNPNPAAAAP